MTSSLPLAGLKVVDFSRVLAGPHCAKTLLDLGADVVKIEPPAMDSSRMAFPRAGQISGYYAQQNAGKRNVSIDLNVPGAREVALRLCDAADVVIENFRPGTMDSFGLGYDVLSARNPRLVYASISGYGQRGPWRTRMAYAPTVQAEVGLTRMTADQFGADTDPGPVGSYGKPGATPRTDSLSHADVYSGLHATIALLAALQERQRTGRGRYVDIAMAAVMLSINERIHADLSDEDLGDETPALGATDGPFFVGPGGERFISSMSLVGSLSFPLYLIAMRRLDLAQDPRFLTPELRKQNLGELHAIVQRWIWTFSDMASLDAQFDMCKIATGQVRSVHDIAESDWAAQWGAFREVPDRKGGTITIPGRPWRFSDAPDTRSETGVADPAVEVPEVQIPAWQGEHNAEVLAELGYSRDEIAKLVELGVVLEPGKG